MSNRRDFANALALVLLGAPTLARPQTGQRLPVVGALWPFQDIRTPIAAALALSLQELGFVEGQNFTFENRFAPGKPELFPSLALELVKLKVDLIFAVGPAAVKAAREQSSQIPIVAFDLETDPVKAGWARSLARPGGNLTGFFLDIPALAGKWIELLRSAAPGIRLIGLLWDSTSGAAQLAAAKAAAQGFGKEVHLMAVRGSEGVAASLKAGIGAGINAIAVLGSPELIRTPVIKLVNDFATNNRLPTISAFRNYPDRGGLMSYGVNQRDFQPRIVAFIARILRGAKPGDLAIELPSKFAFVINLKAARALGIPMPQALLLRADEVIQ